MVQLEDRLSKARDQRIPAARRGGRGAAIVSRRSLACGVLGVAGVLVASLAPASATAATPSAMHSVPPYYVALTTAKPASEPAGLGILKSTATVRVTATAAVLARIKPPRPYIGFEAVSGAANDRSFVLLAEGPADRSTGHVPARFYRLTIDPHAASASGRARLTVLPITIGGLSVDTFALSPDGNSLAAVLSRDFGRYEYLYVYNLKTGTKRIWKREVCDHGRCKQVGLGNEDPFGFADVTLTWAATGRSLAFIAGTGVSQLRLLNLAKRGDDVTPNSTPFRVPRTASSQWFIAYMAPDARAIIIEFETLHGHTLRHVLVRYSAATGKLTTINTFIFSPDYPAQYLRDDVLWVNNTGGKLIVSGVRSTRSAGIYSGTRYTPLKWPANVIGAAW
jgi:hypothetical protein